MKEVVSANIKKYRAEKGYSQQDMANKLNVTRQTYNAYENDPLNLKVSILIEMAVILECHVNDFFKQRIAT